MSLRAKLFRGVLVVVLPLGILLAFALRGGKREIYREYRSPSGAYRLLVYRRGSRFTVLPGDASVSEGYVELRDAGGRVCGRAGLPLVAVASSASDVKWDDDQVSVPEAFDLPLVCR